MYTRHIRERRATPYYWLLFSRRFSSLFSYVAEEWALFMTLRRCRQYRRQSYATYIHVVHYLSHYIYEKNIALHTYWCWVMAMTYYAITLLSLPRRAHIHDIIIISELHVLFSFIIYLSRCFVFEDVTSFHRQPFSSPANMPYATLFEPHYDIEDTPHHYAINLSSSFSRHTRKVAFRILFTTTFPLVSSHSPLFVCLNIRRFG